MGEVVGSGADVGVSEELLDQADVSADFIGGYGSGPAEVVGNELFVDLGFFLEGVPVVVEDGGGDGRALEELDIGDGGLVGAGGIVEDGT